MKKLISSVILAASLPSIASPQETTSFTYDALGRIVTTSVNGGGNNGVVSTADYDPAGNRSRYRVAATTANRPPVANSDTVGVTCRSSTVANLVANDTDPDGDAITLVSITRLSGPGSASVSNSTSVTIVGGTSLGQTSLYDYVIRDARGATATGRLTVQTVGSPQICA